MAYPPDEHATETVGLMSPAVYGVAVTPHDTNLLPFVPRGITCLVGGAVRLGWPDGTTSDHSLALGAIFPARPFRIYATGTAATGIAIVK